MGKDYFTAHLSFNQKLNPFSLSRKADIYTPKTKYPPHRYIVDIEKVSEKECQCIMVEDEQHLYLTNDFIVTHNTYMALYAAMQLMVDNDELQLLYVRSIIESADKGLGSLPGDISEKFDPFLMPLYDKLEEIVVPQDVVWLKNEEKIMAMPINFLRGANWVNKIIVADEAQNFTFKELTTLITRIGHDSKLIICGDFMQSDINGKSGFKPIFNLFNDEESKERGVQTFTFTHEDIVRSEILKFLIGRLENYKPKV
jgi:phosphate starvation-inducible PhoH-like protein